jgi:hypothetical protein
MRSSTPPGRRGATSRIALANWLLGLPGSCNAPPRRRVPPTVTGKPRDRGSVRIDAPRRSRPVASCPSGRSRRRAAPSSREAAWPRAATAVRKRIVVPDAPSATRPPPGTRPAQPCTRQRPGSAWMVIPSAESPSRVARVSSASRGPCSVLSPSASAAATSARCVTLLLGVARSTASSGPRMWRTTRTSIGVQCIMGVRLRHRGFPRSIKDSEAPS